MKLYSKISLCLLASLTSATVQAQVVETPDSMVGALHSAFGEHHARAVHAKGIIFEGTFQASPEARTLSKAPIFSGVTMPVVVRFSDFTGIPDIPDNIGDANPRGFAVKIKMKGGAATDIVTHSFNGFPVATSDEFAVFLRAIGGSGPDVPHPNPIEQFLETHPIAKSFVTSQKPPPVSYATTAYFGVNAFKFTDAQGKSVFVRYRFVPRAGEHYLTPDAVAGAGANYLQPEITARVAKAPVSFDWYAQISETGDVIDNPSIAWPESRRLVRLGTITIASKSADIAAADVQTVFEPGNVPSGIEIADPMLAMRHAAYPISFKARQ